MFVHAYCKDLIQGIESTIDPHVNHIDSVFASSRDDETLLKKILSKSRAFTENTPWMFLIWRFTSILADNQGARNRNIPGVPVSDSGLSKTLRTFRVGSWEIGFSFYSNSALELETVMELLFTEESIRLVKDNAVSIDDIDFDGSYSYTLGFPESFESIGVENFGSVFKMEITASCIGLIGSPNETNANKILSIPFSIYDLNTDELLAEQTIE